VAHGLSLSLGGPDPLDEALVRAVAQFRNDHGIKLYSEHLSYCSDAGHLYDLMPIPFTEEAVHYVAQRIRRVQDIYGEKIAIENVSYYAALHTQQGADMSELEFLLAVLAEADCLLLLDLNNIFVNSINHGYDPAAFLRALPGKRIAYAHMAGHFEQTPELLIDTHGATVKAQVWALLRLAYAQFGVFPTLLERDFNFPPLPQLLAEVELIAQMQGREVTK
jgi:hypothetical protein